MSADTTPSEAAKARAARHVAPNGTASARRILPWSEVRRMTGDKDPSTVWRWERAGLFPKRVKTGPNSVGWFDDEIAAWQASRAGAR